MPHSIAEIARAIGARAEGDVALTVSGAAEPASAGPDSIAVAMQPAYLAALPQGRARAALVAEGTDWSGLGLAAAILVARPRLALAGLTRLLDIGPGGEPGIHPTAVVHPTASVGRGVSLGPYTAVGARAVIGDGARVMSHVSIDDGASVGPGALIHSGVRIGRGVRIGVRFIAQPNAVIGGDGFSFVTEGKSGVERVRETLGDRGEITAQEWVRIHSLGGVEIGDDVEIGSGTAIDAGTIRATRIGRGTKIDNLVHIAHNASVGEDCLLCGQVGISGSTRIGDRVTLGGQCGVSDNIFVGNDVIAGGATKIFTNVLAGRVILGSPAMKMEAHVQAWKNIRRLGRLFDEVKSLRRVISGKGEGGDGGGTS
ncbi:MAG: UDP-3-O-(3-hydroxymyristoyl)glucosamine N-acyltransferase [Paracoccaceae bacterium]